MKIPNVSYSMLAGWLALSLATGCTQGTVTIDGGNACVTPPEKESICVPYGGAQWALLSVEGKDSFIMRNGNLDLGPAMAYLSATKRVLLVDPAKFKGSMLLNSSVVHFRQEAEADTIDLRVALKNLRWIGMADAPGEPVKKALAFCCDEPCDAPIDIDARLSELGSIYLFTEGECAYLGGGETILALESNIIDPSMRWAFNRLDPDLGPWMAEKFPQVDLKAPTFAASLWDISKFGFSSTPNFGMQNALFAQAPKDVNDVCNTLNIEMKLNELDNLNWVRKCSISPLRYNSLEQCQAFVSFRPAPGEPSAMVHDLRECMLKLTLEDGLIHIYVPDHCSARFEGLDCATPSGTK
jgi:hypothetical protein